MRRISVLIVLAVAAGCTDDTVTRVPPHLTLNPTALDFGGIPPGTETSLAIAIVNDNDAEVALTAVKVENASRDVFSITSEVPKKIAPNATASVTVKFKAQDVAGNDSATLKVEPGGGVVPVTATLLGRTLVASCTDGVRNGTETDLDCGGGACPACPAGGACRAPTDCVETAGCSGGKCGGCATSDECRVGLVCQANACGSCAGDGACAAGQTCVFGRCTACPGSAEPIDTRRDVNNCGACGQVCPHPAHASARCEHSRCTRTRCESGWFDVDGERTPGCEAQCQGRVCTDAGGTRTELSAPPIGETGLVGQTLSSGGSLADAVQTSAQYTNVGVLGDATPPALDHAVEQRGGNLRHVGGFQSNLTP